MSQPFDAARGEPDVTRYRVVHRTDYRYGAEVTSGHTVAHLVPRATPGQVVDRSEIEADPLPDHVATHIDAYGNLVTYFAVQVPHRALVVTATSEVTVSRPAPWPTDRDGPAWERVAELVRAERSSDGLLAAECTLPSPMVAPTPDLAGYARPSFPPGRPVDHGVADLCGRIHRDFVFDPSFSDVATPLEEVLEHRRGVCQDFAHLGIGCLRSLGLPARYVSGYIETSPPPGQPKLVGADASHAWLSTYLPGVGWFDIDPTNDQVPPICHITVAWGRDYGDVSPLRGVVFGPATTQELHVSVDVSRTPSPEALGSGTSGGL